MWSPRGDRLPVSGLSRRQRPILPEGEYFPAFFAVVLKSRRETIRTSELAAPRFARCISRVLGQRHGPPVTRIDRPEADVPRPQSPRQLPTRSTFTTMPRS